MKSLLICYSYHHHNTQKVADAMARVLSAEIKTPQQTNLTELSDVGLIGFGAGIDSGRHYKQLLDLAEGLPKVNGKKAFIFSTSGMATPRYMKKCHTALREKLQAKGYVIVNEFNCAGFNTNSFLKVFGGMNKGRPNQEDLKAAEEFALNLKQSI